MTARDRDAGARPDGGAHPDAPSPRIRVAPVILRDGAVLLIRHVKGDRTYWLLPGGGVEYGESLADALRREVREETGLDVDVGPLLFANDSIPPDKRRHVVNLYFLARITGGELTLGDEPNLVELRFVPLDELNGIALYPDIRRELRDAVEAGLPNRAAYLGNLWT